MIKNNNSNALFLCVDLVNNTNIQLLIYGCYLTKVCIYKHDGTKHAAVLIFPEKSPCEIIFHTGILFILFFFFSSF